MMKLFPTRDLIKLAVSIAIPLVAGFVGSIFAARSVATWYETLRKPSFNPPNWLFGPVWTTLYVLMGIALFLVWRRGLSLPGARVAAVLFAVQLGLNAFWSIAFFGLRSPLAGLAVIGALWVALLLTLVTFWRIAAAAGGLLVPYLAWVSFAAILNSSLWWLNR